MPYISERMRKLFYFQDFAAQVNFHFVLSYVVFIQEVFLIIPERV